MTLMSVLLFLNVIIHCKGNVQEQPWPVLVFEKGTQANIPCIIRGEANAYFWKKGATYQTSTHVAANVRGDPDSFANATHGKLTVTENGTLVMNNISFEDDGKYFCRVVSEQSEHFASVTVYSQVSLNTLPLAIEQCPSHPGCKLHFKIGTRKKLTCTASFVPLLVELRWKYYNESSGTTTLRTVKDNKDGSFNISISTELEYEKPSVILCEASSPNMPREVVTVELKTIQESEDGLEIITVVLVVIVIVLAIVIAFGGTFLIVIWKQSKAKAGSYEAVPSTEIKAPQRNREVDQKQPTDLEVEIIKKNEKPTDLEVEIIKKNEKPTDLEAEIIKKNEKITDLEVEIVKINEELRQQREELGKKDEIIMILKKKHDMDLKVMKENAKQIVDFQRTIKEKTSEIENLKKKVEGQAIIIKQRNKQLGITTQSGGDAMGDITESKST